MTFVSLDFETTGTVKGFPNEPWQLGLVEIIPGADVQTLAGTILNDYGTIATTEMLDQVRLGGLNAYGVSGATVQKQLEAYLIPTADGCISVVLGRAGTAPAGWYESLLASAQTLQITG